MAFDQQQPRQMYPANVPCSECNTMVLEVPFPYDPANGRPILCVDCLRKKRRDNDRGGRNDRGGFGGARPPRQMFQGNWTCASCNKGISELPFQPSGDKPLYCRECLRAQRGE